MQFMASARLGKISFDPPSLPSAQPVRERTIVRFEPRFEAWRDAARDLLRRGVAPEDLIWQPLPWTPQTPFEREGDHSRGERFLRVSSTFLDQARRVACARDPWKWELLYRLLDQVAFENSRLDPSNPDVRRFQALDREVARDVHRLRAFTRFEHTAEGRLVARVHPQHPVLELMIPSFRQRLGSQAWSVFTPDLVAHCDNGKVLLSPVF